MLTHSLTVVGFVLHQTHNLHALAQLTSLEELRLEQPDPDTLAAVSGELPLSWLPTSLRTLKLHSVVVPPWGLEGAEGGGAGGAGGRGAGVHGWSAGGEAGGEAGGSAGAGGSGQMGGFGGVRGPGGAFGGGGQMGGGSEVLLMRGVAATAPLPKLRELYLSKCKVPALGVLGVVPQLTALGLINCLSCSGLLPAAAALPGLRSLAVIHTLTPDQESGPSVVSGAVGSSGLPLPAPAPQLPAVVAALKQAAAAGAAGGGGGAAGSSPPAAAALSAAAAAAAASGGVGGSAAAGGGLPLPAVVWGSDEQVAAAAACRGLTTLELIVPRGGAGVAAVGSLAGMGRLRELDLALPCGLSEGMLGLARLGRQGRLERLTLWVDSRTCVNRARTRQLQVGCCGLRGCRCVAGR